jgi:hypothetical protein
MATKKTRKGPTASATAFNVGTKKKGNDGNYWIVVATKANVHKWQKITKTMKTSIKSSRKPSTNSKMKQCEDFCKNDYKDHIVKHREKNQKKYNYIYSATNKADQFGYATCKKSYCNEKCEGLDFFGDKEEELAHKKKIKNSFMNTFSAKQVEMLKKRGALSGCMNPRGATQLLGLG